MKNNFLKWAVKLLIIAVPVILYFSVASVKTVADEIFQMLKNVDMQAIKDYILSFGIWAPVISFLLMLFQSLIAPLPSFVLTFVNAALFGWWQGAILSWFGTLAGATMCFWIARFFGRDVVAKFTTKGALVKVDKFFVRYGKYAVLMARLVPFLSFDVISYGAGLTSMRFGSFFWATAIGQIPVTVVYSYVGGMLTGSSKTVVIGLLLLISLGVLIAMVTKILKDRNTVSVDKK